MVGTQTTLHLNKHATTDQRPDRSSSDPVIMPRSTTASASNEHGFSVIAGTTPPTVIESVLPGTFAGELDLFVNRERSNTLIADTDAVLWFLSRENYERACRDDPALMLMFTRLALTYAAQGVNKLTAQALFL
jgi:CRP-like cAMP-binding protein